MTKKFSLPLHPPPKREMRTFTGDTVKAPDPFYHPHPQFLPPANLNKKQLPFFHAS